MARNALRDRKARRLGMRRRFLGLMAVAALALSNTGCLINIWSSDPEIRMQQLMNASEDLRQIEYEWRRAWFTDQPSHLTPIRVHGGVGP
jgi:hypothetical protein